MVEKIDPFALKTKDEVQRVRSENQKERIAPYRPSIDPLRVDSAIECFLSN
jgi:hypothetical protein